MYRIAPKPFCEAPGCQKTKVIGCGKYCHDHRHLDPGFDRKEKKRVANGTGAKLRMLSNSKNSTQGGYVKPEDNKLVDNAGAKRLKELKKFFAEAAVEIEKSPYCWECKTEIAPWDYRNSTGHIIPKGIFHSVETHPLNYVLVGNRCGCHNLTHRMDTFAKMRIFPLAVERFRQFEHLITEKHKLLDEFLKYANLIML